MPGVGLGPQSSYLCLDGMTHACHRTWLICWDGGLASFLPGLASRQDPPDLYLLSIWDYSVNHHAQPPKKHFKREVMLKKYYFGFKLSLKIRCTWVCTSYLLSFTSQIQSWAALLILKNLLHSLFYSRKSIEKFSLVCIFFFLFLQYLQVWTQGLIFAKQVFYHLSQPPNPPTRIWCPTRKMHKSLQTSDCKVG
jgi:hypothetical protein